MNRGILGLGIALMVLGLILMPFLYPLVDIDTAEEASQKTRLYNPNTDPPLKFKGKVKEVIEKEFFTQQQTITIEGLEGLLGNIHVVTGNKSISEGQEVIVEGRFYGLLTVGYIMGDYNEDAGKIDPAKVEGVPTTSFILAVVLFLVGLVLTIWGYVKI
jgi:hypothetical protein